jgi:type IV pilus assembly protein PilN
MRFKINLASQPYEVAREYKRGMTVLIAALAVVAVVLVSYILYQRAHSRTINRETATVRRQIESLNHEESQARAILNKPASRVIADQSEFLNDLFARKSMSWTRIFTVMEKIMPADIHVVSMKPEYSKTHDLVLHVVVATDSRDRAVELVRNMEKSSHFRDSQVVAEIVRTDKGGAQPAEAGAIQFDIASIYVPDAGDTDDGADAAGAKHASPQSSASTATGRHPSGNAAAAPTNGSVKVNAQNRPIAPGK